MNDIVINNLDLGYEQCKEINSFSLSTGDDLLNNLSSNIANLKSHWVGTDATAHINNLINDGYLIRENNHIKINKKYMYISNEIIVRILE